MDNVKYLLILLLVIALPVAGSVLKRMANAKGDELGRRRLANRTVQALEQLAVSLDVAADPAAAARLVTEVADTMKKWRRAGELEWHREVLYPADIVVRLDPTETGCRLAVVRTHESVTVPQGVRDWERFRDAVAAAATTNGVATATTASHSMVRVPRQEPAGIGQSDHLWVRADA